MEPEPSLSEKIINQLPTILVFVGVACLVIGVIVRGIWTYIRFKKYGRADLLRTNMFRISCRLLLIITVSLVVLTYAISEFLPLRVFTIPSAILPITVPLVLLGLSLFLKQDEKTVVASFVQLILSILSMFFFAVLIVRFSSDLEIATLTEPFSVINQPMYTLGFFTEDQWRFVLVVHILGIILYALISILTGIKLKMCASKTSMDLLE